MPGPQSQTVAIAAPPTDMVSWHQYLESALAGRLDVPPLSKVSADIAAMAADGDANTAVLAQLIERDPTVAANVLRVANSAALAPRVPIVTMQQAIAWLGMGEIQAIATAVAVRSRLYASGAHDTLLKPMWRRSVATAYWAREIARPRRLLPDLAHLCGLLCRIGRPVVVRCIARAPDGAESRLSDASKLALVDAFEERAGVALSRVWALPEPVSTALHHWRDVAFASGWDVQLRQVRLADLLAARSLGEPLGAQHQARVRAAIHDLQLHHDEIAGLEASAVAVRQALAALD